MNGKRAAHVWVGHGRRPCRKPLCRTRPAQTGSGLRPVSTYAVREFVMISPRHSARFAVFLFSTALIACAPIKKVGSGTVAVFKKSTSTVASGFAAIPKPRMPDLSLANLMPGPKIKVVEPREKDLKEMPTGMELAQSRRRPGFAQGFADLWPFSGKLYFEEPNFPEPGMNMDDTLLPPKAP